MMARAILPYPIRLGTNMKMLSVFMGFTILNTCNRGHSNDNKKLFQEHDLAASFISKFFVIISQDYVEDVCFHDVCIAVWKKGIWSRYWRNIQKNPLPLCSVNCYCLITHVRLPCVNWSWYRCSFHNSAVGYIFCQTDPNRNFFSSLTMFLKFGYTIKGSNL